MVMAAAVLTMLGVPGDLDEAGVALARTAELIATRGLDDAGGFELTVEAVAPALGGGFLPGGPPSWRGEPGDVNPLLRWDDEAATRGNRSRFAATLRPPGTRPLATVRLFDGADSWIHDPDRRSADRFRGASERGGAGARLLPRLDRLPGRAGRVARDGGGFGRAVPAGPARPVGALRGGGARGGRRDRLRDPGAPRARPALARPQPRLGARPPRVALGPRGAAQAADRPRGGANVLFGDGSARFVAKSIDSWPVAPKYHVPVGMVMWYDGSKGVPRPGVWQALATRAGGEPPGDF